jgi:hypothetical protein
MGTRDLLLAHFVAVTPARAAQVRRAPSAVTTLREGTREETGIGHYWHGMQYLLAGRAKGVRGPLAWFTGGGEKLGRTPAGPVRYLSPEQVNELSAVLDGTGPDDLGDDVYDEAAMDAAGVYPGRWVRNGESFDQLGSARCVSSFPTLRERRAALQKKCGAPVIMPAELASAAKAWEAWWAKQAV